MTLFDLTRDYLAYLVKFREMAPTAAAPGADELRSEITRRLLAMQEAVQDDPRLASSYAQVEYALVALADEIALTSDWDQEGTWRQHTLERGMWGTDQRAEHFFTRAAGLASAPQDVAAIFYLILGLGFTGGHDPDDPKLETLKKEILALLPEGGAPPTPPAPAYRERPVSRPLRLALLAVLAVGWAVAAVILLWQTGLRPPIPGKLAKTAQTTTRAPSTTVSPTSTSLSTTTSIVTAPPATSATLAAVLPSVSDTTTSAAPAAPAPSPLEKPRPRASQGQFDLQVAVFVGPVQSGRLAADLKEMGLPARTDTWRRDDGKDWYVVMVGPVDGMDQAMDIRRKLTERFKVKAIIKPRSAE